MVATSRPAGASGAKHSVVMARRASPRSQSRRVISCRWALFACLLILASAVAAAAAVPPGDEARDLLEREVVPGPPAGSQGDGGDKEEESIWTPLPTDPKGVVGIFLAVVFIAVAAGSGLGGGGVLVPLYITMLDVNAMHAVALSNVTILGSSIMNVIINSRREHPAVHTRRMIDWEVVLVMEPSSILGTVLGAIMNKTFPVWLSMILMLAFLVATTVRTFKKALKLYGLESRALEANDVTPAESTFEGFRKDPPMSYPPAGRAATIPHSRSLAEIKTASHAELVLERTLSFLDLAVSEKQFEGSYNHHHKNSDYEALQDEAPLLAHRSDEGKPPLGGGMAAIVPMVALQAVVIVLFVVKKTSECGSGLFWSITLSFIPLTLAFVLGARCYLKNLHQRRLEGVAAGTYAFAQGDCMWDDSKFFVYPLVAILAGVIAAWFGLGGGIVKGPLLMELGLLPEVVVATSSTMMLFTTLSSVCGYIAMQRLLVYYGALLFAVALVTTLVAQLGLKRIINRLRRPSLVIFLFATVCLLGAFGILFTSYEDIAAIFHGHVDGFRGICSDAN